MSYNNLFWLGVGGLGYLAYEYNRLQKAQPVKADRGVRRRVAMHEVLGAGQHDLHQYEGIEPGDHGMPRFRYSVGEYEYTTYAPHHLVN